tara:strand:- start:24011 stop:24730 length:720 start_codon:yes stop_codon:yes gene_type:complete
MKVETIKCLTDNFSYLVIDEFTNETFVIDPSEYEPIKKFVISRNLNLKFILNTHHHYDHIGGNEKLKQKFNCKIIGFEKDKKRIPGIDIKLMDREIWRYKKFEFKIYHVPGHTTNHVIYHFFNEKFLFSGDTLFSLGCGRVFEGTNEQMFESLNLIKKFPKETKVYFGHEYTQQNSNFCIINDPNNLNLKKKVEQINKRLNNKLSTTPTTIKDEIDCNIFLRSEDLKSFSKIRELKDNF